MAIFSITALYPGVPGMPDTQLQREVDFFTKGSMIQINVVSLKGAKGRRSLLFNRVCNKPKKGMKI